MAYPQLINFKTKSQSSFSSSGRRPHFMLTKARNTQTAVTTAHGHGRVYKLSFIFNHWRASNQTTSRHKIARPAPHAFPHHKIEPTTDGRNDEVIVAAKANRPSNLSFSYNHPSLKVLLLPLLRSQEKFTTNQCRQPIPAVEHKNQQRNSHHIKHRATQISMKVEDRLLLC